MTALYGSKKETYDFYKKTDRVDTVYFWSVAERTGLEPATPGVTGRYSNQLNYRSEFQNRCIAT